MWVSIVNDNVLSQKEENLIQAKHTLGKTPPKTAYFLQTCRNTQLGKNLMNSHDVDVEEKLLDESMMTNTAPGKISIFLGRIGS